MVSGCIPQCSMCGTEAATTIHVFWDCSKVQPLWSQLIAWCESKFKLNVQYTKVNCLIKGFQYPVLNNVMLACKYHIYLLSCFGGSFAFKHLVEHILHWKAADISAYKQLPYLKITTALRLWKPLLKKA